MKTGLVLEGGGMRGIYTAGVLDVFMEHGITVDGVMGVSAGSIHGASYVSRQQGRNIRYIKKYCNYWRFMSFRSLIVTGDIVGYKFSYEELPYKLDPFDFKTFLNNPVRLYASVTNLNTGKAEYLPVQDPKDCLDVIRASSSMPLVSRIVHLHGQEYLDGGTSDSIPLRAFMRMGYDRNIVVLTQPEGYRKKPASLMSLFKWKYRKYPAYIETNANRYLMYNAEVEDVEEMARQGKILLIRPSRKVPISRVEQRPEVVQEQYDLGRSDALAMLSRVKTFLNLTDASK